jgi:imidazolonepropionase-like amidohydrolase
MIPVARVNGVTTALVSPSRSLFCGTAALVNLHGYTPEQMGAGFEGVVLEFPSSAKRGSGDKRSEDEIKKEVEKLMKQLNEIWEKAVQYYKIDSARNGKGVAYYPEFEALLPVVKAQQFLMIEVNTACDIRSAIEWVEEKKIKKVIFMGVSEGWRVAEEIAKSGFPVITGPVMALPSREYDRYDKPYENASLMKKAGVKVALRTSEIENVRNLPYNAGFAAAYGMGREEALKAITIVPAEIFGVSDKIGSIEIGKQANLFVSDGDPFETKTQLKYLFIGGWQIPLVSRQSELYDEFLHREPGLKK